MEKLSLDKFTIMKLDNSSKVELSDKKADETITHGDMVCVSGSALEVTREEQIEKYKTTACNN